LVSGDVDLAAAPDLLEQILEAGRSCAPGEHVILDLAGVTFIDSSGLALLVDAHRRIAAEDQVLLLGEVPARVQRLLELTGLDQLFRLEAELAERNRAS
jgi:anti-sigma B factor antagonist